MARNKETNQFILKVSSGSGKGADRAGLRHRSVLYCAILGEQIGQSLAENV